MSYDPRDPRSRDPRTARYDPGYDPQAYTQGQYDPRYYDDPQYGQGQPARGSYEQGRPAKRAVAPDINPGLFAGGVVMTGVVTALAAWLLAWVIAAIVQRVNEVGSLGVWNPMARDEFWFGVVAFLCALAAGALWYVLQIVTPSPSQFYRWIVGLLLIAAVVIPLLLSAEFSVGLATAAMHLVIGLPLLTLIPAMGEKSVNRR